MKKRYIFPLIYIALFLLSFGIPILGDFIAVFLETFISLIALGFVLAFDLPKNTITYFVVFGTILQFYLIGYLWDKISQKMQ